MYDSRNKRPRRPRRSSSGGSDMAAGENVLDRYIDHNGDERLVVGITDGSVHDPQAEIFEPDGETFNVNLAERKAVRVCAPDHHDLIDDPSETEFEAVTCRNCPYGRLVRKK